jgi:hypothetical protein
MIRPLLPHHRRSPEIPDPQRYSSQPVRPDGPSAAEPLSRAHRPWYLQQLHCCHQCGGNHKQFVFRIDQNVTETQRLFFRLSYWNLLNLPLDPLGTGLCVDRCGETVHTKAGVFDYNVNFSPTTIGDFNFSVSRFGYNRSPKNAGFDLTTIG